MNKFGKTPADVIGELHPLFKGLMFVAAARSDDETRHVLNHVLVEREGIGVVDVAVVRDGRRYSPVCTDGCCPSEGEPLLDPSTVPAVAELVARGRAPLAGREDVARIVDPSPSAEDLTAGLGRLPRG